MSIGWKSLITGLLVALISALIIYIVARIWYILSRKDKLHIKRLISPKDKDVSKLVEVYEDLIDANSISPQADIKRWLDEYEKSRKDPKHTLEEYWLVAKLADRIVGFLFFQYYLDSKFLFISYFGADKSFLKDTRVTSDAILAEFRKRLNKELKECRGIIYETESADGNLAERARIRKFKSYAKKLGFKAYEIGIDYMTPKLSIDPKEVYKEEWVTLSYIPLKQVPQNNTLSKDEVVEIISFVYNNVYGDAFNNDIEKSKKYHEYLSSLVEMYKNNLPDVIQLYE